MEDGFAEISVVRSGMMTEVGSVRTAKGERMSETNCMTCMIGNFKNSLCDDRLCKKYARNGSYDDFEKFLLDKDLMVVVRCKDCEYWKHSSYWHSNYCELTSTECEEDHFCSWGEKKDEG